MELYTLDNALRRHTVIDRYESLIWTERNRAMGDFELRMDNNSNNRSIFSAGTKLALNESHRVMQVEDIENKDDSEGRSIMSVTGRSLELILEDRVAVGSITDLTTNPKWELTGTPTQIARKIFNDICVTGKLDLKDRIPFIATGSMFPPDTIGAPIQTITHEVEPKSVYDAVKEICDIYGLGFRLVRNFDQSQLFFEIYTGVDRTTKQDDFKPVIFSPELDNLENVTELTSSSGYKNVAYVFSKYGARIVYALGVDPTAAGFERRVVPIIANDIEIQDGPELQDLLLKRGQEELTKYRPMFGFDGEVTQYGGYKYLVDYNLGDLVEMRSSEGVTNNMRVTEQIFVSDAEGDRSYPTLTVDLFVQQGTWIAWDYNQVWPEAIGEWKDV